MDRHLDGLTLEDSPLEWSLKIKEIGEPGLKGSIIASDEELHKVTQMLRDDHDLEVLSLICNYKVRFLPGRHRGLDQYKGRFTIIAKLRQTCVITLERIVTQVKEEFSQDFVPAGGGESHGSSAPRGESRAPGDEDPLADEPPREIVKGEINFGPLIYEYLAMAIDPNPRGEGAMFQEEETESEGDESKPPSPFAILKNQNEEQN